MSRSERDGLLARVRQLRRVPSPTADPLSRPRPAAPDRELQALHSRVAQLEDLLQGLQDSVHRESLRHSKRIGELEARVEPGAMARALDQDARQRGL